MNTISSRARWIPYIVRPDTINLAWHPLKNIPYMAARWIRPTLFFGYCPMNKHFVVSNIELPETLSRLFLWMLPTTKTLLPDSSLTTNKTRYLAVVLKCVRGVRGLKRRMGHTKGVREVLLYVFNFKLSNLNPCQWVAYLDRNSKISAEKIDAKNVCSRWANHGVVCCMTWYNGPFENGPR